MLERDTRKPIEGYHHKRPPSLTERHLEILSLLAMHGTHKIVAVHAGIGIATVKNHVTAILRILRESYPKCDTVVQAVAIALTEGWIKRK